MAFCPTDGPEVQYEFFAPFAHVPGRFEWCRIRSPSHGVFDTLILLGESTAHPACVYVNASMGESFMQERFPESTCIRVPAGALRIQEEDGGRTVVGSLEAEEGPLQSAAMRLEGKPGHPQAVPYGGDGSATWGSRWTCWGVDLQIEALAHGEVVPREGDAIRLRNTPAIVTLGSMGRLEPRSG